MSTSKQFRCYNSDGFDIEVEVISDTGKYNTAKLRKAIKPSWDPDEQSKIAIYKWDVANNCKVGDPIAASDDLVSEFGTVFAYELPPIHPQYVLPTGLADGRSTAAVPGGSSPHQSSGQALTLVKFKLACPAMSIPTVILADLLSCVITDPPTTGTEQGVQKWLVDVAEALKSDTPCQLVADMHPKPALTVDPLCELKPDAVLFVRGLASLNGAAVAAVELKAPEVSVETADTSIQIFKYMHAILYHQPNRTFCYGLLTNGKTIRFFQATVNPTVHHHRTKSDFTYTLLRNCSFAEGKPFLAWLLSAELDVLGYVPLTVTLKGEKHQLVDYVGSGQHCHGYALKISDSEVVVKHYRDKDMAELERTTCKTLKGAPHVSQLHGVQPDDPLFVAITPRGFPFDKDHPINAAHVSCLCVALDSLHKKGLAHRDVCGSNIYWESDTSAFLNDWSHVEPMPGNLNDAKRWRTKDYTKLRRAIIAVGADVDLDELVGSPSKRVRENTVSQ